MEKAKRNLKVLSILILALAVYSLIRVVLSVFMIDFDLNNLPDGATPGLVLGGQIFICVFSLILSLPQIYVGLKGIKVSNTPDSSKGHIVWAVILAVLSVIAITGPISNIINNVDLLTNVIDLIDIVLDAVIYIVYIKFAKQIRR